MPPMSQLHRDDTGVRLSLHQRSTIRTLNGIAGWSLRRVSDKLQLPIATVQHVVSSRLTPRANRVSVFKINTPARREITDLLEQSPGARRMTHGELKARLGLNCSDSTLARALSKEGFKRCIATSKPYLSPSNIEARLAFAVAHQDWTVDDWLRVNFTDEAAFYQGEHRRQWVTRRPHEAGLRACVVSKFKRGSAHMVHGQICNGVKGPLTRWDRTVEGTLNSIGYSTVIVPVIADWIQEVQYVRSELGQYPSVLHMHDNAPSHKAALTITAMEAHNIRVLPWPSCSPDLNPIEWVWATIKAAIARYPRRPTSREALYEAVEAEWEAIGDDEIYDIVSTMPARISAVIAAAGGPTRY